MSNSDQMRHPLHIHIYIYTYYTHICIHVYTYVYTYVHVYIYIYIYVYIYTCICIYIYVYIYTRIYIYTHICIHIERFLRLQQMRSQFGSTIWWFLMAGGSQFGSRWTEWFPHLPMIRVTMIPAMDPYGCPWLPWRSCVRLRRIIIFPSCFTSSRLAWQLQKEHHPLLMTVSISFSWRYPGACFVPDLLPGSTPLTGDVFFGFVNGDFTAEIPVATSESMLKHQYTYLLYVI